MAWQGPVNDWGWFRLFITACPVCSKELRGLLGLKRCPQCLSYGQVSEGQYYELTADFVAKAPLLAMPLGEDRKMPPLCCACGAPADRTERLRIIRLEFVFDLDVPHCALHTGGADLDAITVAGKSKAQARAEGEVVCLLPRLHKNELPIPGQHAYHR